MQLRADHVDSNATGLRLGKLFEGMKHRFEVREAPLVGKQVHGVANELGATELLHHRIDGRLQRRPRNDGVAHDPSKLWALFPCIGKRANVSEHGIDLTLLAG
jgi:hypothetical protein